jgi:hypothetical protein
MFIPILPANVELQTQITAAAAEAMKEMLRSISTGGTSATLPVEVTLNHDYPM